MSRRGWVLFALMAITWGIPYLLIKVAAAEMPPVVLVFGRTALGAMVRLPLAAARSWLRPGRSDSRDGHHILRPGRGDRRRGALPERAGHGGDARRVLAVGSYVGTRRRAPNAMPGSP